MDHPRILLLENIRSLHNVGSLFRSADASGWSKVYCCGYTGTPPDRRIEKVSLGAENFIEWEKAEDPLEVVQQKKKEGYSIIALEQTAKSVSIFGHFDIPEKCLLVLGNEVTGVSDDLLSVSDIHLEIPMHGQKSSLNVSVAGAIAMYEVGVY